MSDFNVCDISNLSSKIIPFFMQYQLQGSKYLDFMDFCIIINIILKKEHLTLNGLNSIKATNPERVCGNRSHH
jgi:hypothetical protein